MGIQGTGQIFGSRWTRIFRMHGVSRAKFASNHTPPPVAGPTQQGENNRLAIDINGNVTSDAPVGITGRNMPLKMDDDSDGDADGEPLSDGGGIVDLMDDAAMLQLYFWMRPTKKLLDDLPPETCARAIDMKCATTARQAEHAEMEAVEFMTTAIEHLQGRDLSLAGPLAALTAVAERCEDDRVKEFAQLALTPFGDTYRDAIAAQLKAWEEAPAPKDDGR